MKLIRAFLAILFALVSVAAEAAHGGVSAPHAIAAANAYSIAEHQDSHCLHTERLGGDAIAGCDFAAFCLLLCGAVTPAGPESARETPSFAALFDPTVDPLTGVFLRPEAPPPRFHFL